MQVVVTFRNIEATDALRDHAVAKLRRVRKFMRRPMEAHVVLAVEKHRHIADVKVTASRTTFNAAEETDDLYTAIDLAMSKIERQVKKHASKQQSRKHESVPVDRREPRDAGAPFFRVEHVAVKPMSIEDAISELESGQQEVLIFENPESDVLNIVYRRKEGGYTVVEPEVVWE